MDLPSIVWSHVDVAYYKLFHLNKFDKNDKHNMSLIDDIVDWHIHGAKKVGFEFQIMLLASDIDKLNTSDCIAFLSKTSYVDTQSQELSPLDKKCLFDCILAYNIHPLFGILQYQHYIGNKTFDWYKEYTRVDNMLLGVKTTAASYAKNLQYTYYMCRQKYILDELEIIYSQILTSVPIIDRKVLAKKSAELRMDYQQSYVIMYDLV